MPDFDDDLRALAGHAQRTGRLNPAKEIRARADRRRKRRNVATGALGVALVAALGVGIAAARPNPGPNPAPPAAPASASASAAPADVLSGRRQVIFEVLDVGQPVPGVVLSVSAGNRLQAGKADNERALFVPTPAGPDHYLIKTGTLRKAGAALCLAIRSNNSQPSTVVTATCDPTAAVQLFTFKSNGEDEQNRTNYGIAQDSVYLQWSPTGNSGLTAAETGGYLPDLTVVPVDRGPSTVPN